MEKTELIKEIINLHRKVNRILRDYDVDVWMELSLTVPQLKCLFFISNQGKTNFRKLAERLKVSPSNITGIIDRLVEQGLVSRTENPEDRRILLLQTTSKGEAMIAELREKRSTYLAQILTDLKVENLENITEGLKELARAAEEYSSKSAIKDSAFAIKG
jgi:MarR family transcriptional regulator, organic hydroperoxide resistance regulator